MFLGPQAGALQKMCDVPNSWSQTLCLLMTVMMWSAGGSVSKHIQSWDALISPHVQKLKSSV